MLKAIRAPKLVMRTVRMLIPMWATDILAQTEDGTAKLPVSFERGLFQGDSLSPLLFCLNCPGKCGRERDSKTSTAPSQ